MKVIVVGGTGGMGQGVARDLIKQEQIDIRHSRRHQYRPGEVQDKLRASDKDIPQKNRRTRSPAAWWAPSGGATWSSTVPGPSTRRPWP